MRREHELDAQPANGVVQRGGCDATRDKTLERLLTGARLRRRMAIGEVGTSPPNTVVLLGDVGKIQKVGKGARERRRRFDGKPRKIRCQLRKLRLVARTRRLRQSAHALDGFEQRVAAMCSQRVAEELPQQPHIVAQRLVGIVDHLFIVEQIEQRDRFTSDRRLQRRLQIR